MVELDRSQEEAASIAPDERQVVIAGPGAGKTAVIGALASRLVTGHQVFPEEIWVLSFSRAAVSAVRSRTVNVSDQGRGLEVFTIDSLAAQFLSAAAPRCEFTSYDQAIRLATGELEANGWDDILDVRHLIVDEAQDVVGTRAEFILALLRALPEDAGFTMLGDPMQSLYDFQGNGHSDESTGRLLDLVDQEFSPSHRTLTESYRARTDDARRANGLRSLLLISKEPLLPLKAMLSDLSPMGPLNESSISDIGAWPGTTALLCDTNARATLTFDIFMAHGIHAELASGLQNAGIAAWIARLYHEDRSRLSRAEFLELTEGHVTNAQEMWLKLVHLSRSGRELDVAALARGLALHRPPEVMRSPCSPVLVSTVHRAKGLEFDNVVLVDVDQWRDDENESVLANQIFVAATRPQARLTTATGVDTKGWYRRKAPPRLWVKGFRGGMTGLMLEPDLLHPLRVPTSPNITGRRVTWGQAAADRAIDAGSTPTWHASVDGTPVAVTSLQLGSMFAQASVRGLVPDFEGGWVEGYDTQVGNTPTGIGMWNGARVAGTISLDWRQ